MLESLDIDQIRELVFTQYPFASTDDENVILEQLNGERYRPLIEKLRRNLDDLGNRCAVYAFLKNLFDQDNRKSNPTSKSSLNDSVLHKFEIVSKSTPAIWELMGFVSLLKMDAITMFISILSSKSAVERKLLAKHAHTIVFEARQSGLFNKVSREMLNFPKTLLSKEDYDNLWRSVKADLKQTSDIDIEKDIRNNIDAHKSNSFECQYNTFRSCKWSQAVFDLIVLIQISDRILEAIESILSNYKHEMDIISDQLKENVLRYDLLAEQLRNL